ncbi:MAG TPA: hypothetical protein VG778_01565 [Blastocatellia bacterium]|jgi:hypothetical protein|nr:hypothetical protein [Blastocatellia bacterium]
MDQHEFPHELNPELRRLAVLDNERERFAVELARSKERLLSRIRKFFLFSAPLPVLGVLWLAGSSHPLVELLVVSFLAAGPHVATILLLTGQIAAARRKLRQWDQIVSDYREQQRKQND